MLKDSTINYNACFDALFEASRDVIVVLDEHHLIKKSNPALAKNFPAPPIDKLLNKPFSHLIGLDSYNNFFN